VARFTARLLPAPNPELHPFWMNKPLGQPAINSRDKPSDPSVETLSAMMT